MKQIGCQNLKITLLQLDDSGQFLVSGASDGTFMVNTFLLITLCVFLLVFISMIFILHRFL